MSITYDPMTGEPIETPDEEVKEVAAEATAAAEEVKEEVKEEAKEVEETAVEAVETTEAAVSEGNNFDPMTGEPVTTPASQPAGGNDAPVKSDYSPIPAEPTNDDNPKFKLIGIAAIALICVALILAIIFGGLISSKKDKVKKAIKSTFTVETGLTKVAKDLSGILNSQDYTVEFDADLDDLGNISGQSIVAGKEKQVIVDLDIDEIPSMSAKIGIDSKQVKAEIPEICDKLFVYDYTADKDGMITDYVDEDELKSLDASLKMIYDGYNSDTDELQKELTKCMNKHLKELEFENADKKSYKIDGKKVECKGYSVEIDKDFCLDLWDDITDIYVDEYKDKFEGLEEVSGESLEDSFKEARNELKSMPDMTVYFYIYKGKLASIKAEGDKKSGEIEILFKGGDYRAQNISVEADGEEVFALTGSTKKDKEIYGIEIDGEEVCTVEYNTKKGSLAISYDYYYDEFELEMDIDSSSSEVSFEIKDFDFDDDVSGSMNFKFKKGAKIEKYTNTDEFDVGEASQSDFMDLIESFDSDVLEEFGGLFF